MTKLSLFFILILFPILVWSTDHTAKHYKATRLSGPTPEIDGVLDDPAWQQGEWSGDFIQFEPYNGRNPSQQKKFKILMPKSVSAAISLWMYPSILTSARWKLILHK